MQDLITKAKTFYTEHKTAVLAVGAVVIGLIIWKKMKK